MNDDLPALPEQLRRHKDWTVAEAMELIPAAADEIERLRAEVEALRAKRVPLTDEQIEEAHAEASRRINFCAPSHRDIARAIERAHGIDAARAEKEDHA